MATGQGSAEFARNLRAGNLSEKLQDSSRKLQVKTWNKTQSADVWLISGMA
jgi:hypothetical protein